MGALEGRVVLVTGGGNGIGRDCALIAAQEGEIVEMQAWLATNAGEAPTALGQTGGTVYSANEGGNSISAIDLGTGSVETVDVGVSPHNVDLTPDGNLLLAVGSPAATSCAKVGPDSTITDARGQVSRATW